MARSTQKERLARQALLKALQVRKKANIEFWWPLSIFDVVESAGIEVWFLEASSLEGMYSESPRVICIGSERPPGRQAFTCAHEYGHHLFGHGTRVDELGDHNAKGAKFKPEEYLADAFAGFFLMPKVAVEHTFRNRGWSLCQPSPTEVYTVAGYLGVGYSSLIQHMSSALDLMPRNVASELFKFQPKRIRASLLGRPVESNIIIVDEHWQHRPIDIAVGDFILAKSQPMADGECIRRVGQTFEGWLFQGVCTGGGFMEDLGWSSQVRVSRRLFAGWNRYRFQEKGTDDDYAD